MKNKSNISAYIIRSAAWAVFLSMALVGVSAAFNSRHRIAKGSAPPRVLTFVERVTYQRAIEEVYWRHRIWPRNVGENPDPKPSLDAVMTQAQLEKKVTDYLRNSQELEDFWQRPTTAEQLQAEMDRMARDTKQPEVLRELFEALGNDPAVVAECLARPILAERFIADLSAQDQTRHVRSLQTDAVRAMSAETKLGQAVYTLPKIAVGGQCTDNWAATNTTNAPSARLQHTAVWTGSEMIVWGGYYPGRLNTGGRYNPSTNSWTATSTTNAPSARWLHTAVWTGSEMIVWGGVGGSNTGGKYNPGTDSWVPTSLTNAPSARSAHTAVWTGSEMIVWGGSRFNTGGRYNPNTDSWTATSRTNAPTPRSIHTAVWTGSEMIVWGGYFYDGASHWFNTGGRYNPNTNSWTATSTANTLTPRSNHTAVWTGSEMIVWGGYFYDGAHPRWFDTGGRYNPNTDSWTATSATNAPTARANHTAVWTGSEMIVWGGESPLTNIGERYDPDTDSWTVITTNNAPIHRAYHTAVWTGSEMIVWGGADGGNPPFLNTGGTYCAPELPPQLGNISTRAFVQTADNVMIGGFIVQGTDPKRVIIRAIGPALTQYGVPNALGNPTLELHDGTGALIASNNNWATTIIGGIVMANQVRDIRSSGYAPVDDLESAIIADLPPGNYTAVVRGLNNMIGVALVEVYDLSPETNSTLGNLRYSQLCADR